MNNKSVRRTPIRWGTSEFNLVADRWISFCEAHAQDPLKPTMPLSRIIDDAQNALPVELHRPRPSLQGVKNLKPVIETVRVKVRKRQEQQAQEAQEQARKHQDGTAAVETARDNLHGTNDQLVLRSSKDGVLDERKLETIIHDFAHNIATVIASHTMQVLREEFKNEFPKLHSRALSSTKVLPKLLVIGPLGKQQEELERAVDGVVDLKFVSSEESPRLVSLRGPSCQGCVLWTAFINHAHQEAAMKVFGRDSVTMVQGRGLTSVKDTLENVAIQLTSPA